MQSLKTEIYAIPIIIRDTRIVPYHCPVIIRTCTLHVAISLWLSKVAILKIDYHLDLLLKISNYEHCICTDYVYLVNTNTALWIGFVPLLCGYSVSNVMPFVLFVRFYRIMLYMLSHLFLPHVRIGNYLKFSAFALPYYILCTCYLRTSKRWPFKTFLKFLMLSLVNIYISLNGPNICLIDYGVLPRLDWIARACRVHDRPVC